MKRLLLFLFYVAVFFLLFGSCATKKMEYISKDYELFGTWVNPDYEHGEFHPKFILHPNGEVDWYDLVSDSVTALQGEIIITNKWVDSKGKVWYTFILRQSTFDVRLMPPTWWYVLAQLSNSGNTVNFSMTYTDYPKVMDQNNPTSTPNYHYYNRK